MSIWAILPIFVWFLAKIEIDINASNFVTKALENSPENTIKVEILSFSCLPAGCHIDVIWWSYGYLKIGLKMAKNQGKQHIQM